ncbi:MAG TPA: trigger factor [Bacteroidales bacterium]|nr:trigger factor [Bacteroidales bacterium]
MNIVLENKDNRQALLKIELKKEDYTEKVSNELKKLQRKAQMPGFRPGKVPMGIVNKMYGKTVKADEINKILIDEIYNYLKEKEIEILGNPLPDQEAAESIDWDSQSDFNFIYEIGLAPQVNIDFSSNIEVEFPKIVVEDQTVDSYINDICRRQGTLINPEAAEPDDVLFGEFAELAQPDTLKPGGHTHKARLLIEYVSDDNLRQKLIGITVGQHIDFNLIDAIKNEAEVASMLGIKKEELGNYNPDFRFTIEKISRIEPANLDQALYDKVFPNAGITDEEEFRKAVANQISLKYQVDGDKHFRNEVMKTLIKRASLELPETFLKKWIVASNKGEYTPERIEQEFPKLADSFRWQLIENHLVKTYNIQVNEEEVNGHLAEYIRNQFRQYGQQELEQPVVDNFVQRIKNNKEELKKVYDNLADQKLMTLFKEKLKLKVVEFSFDDFVKFVTEKYQAEQVSE